MYGKENSQAELLLPLNVEFSTVTLLAANTRAPLPKDFRPVKLESPITILMPLKVIVLPGS